MKSPRTPAPASTKKPYTTPRLEPLGSVDELSRRFHGAPPVEERGSGSSRSRRERECRPREHGHDTHGAVGGAPP